MARAPPATDHGGVPPELRRLFAAQGRVVTSAQLLEHLSRRTVQRRLRSRELVKIWPGIYSLGEPDRLRLLRGLDLRCGEPVVACLSTAAAMYGFDTEDDPNLHVLNPVGHRLRHDDGLRVHRREGAPLTTWRGRRLTRPDWTAIETARSLSRPRALATLDAALRSGTCDPRGLTIAAEAQTGRRGIVMVRDLIPLARPQAESPMESEARLAMVDGGLPAPTLQYEVVDRDGRRWRLDFAWPELMFAVEYDGFEWHSDAEHLRRDRQKRAALQELGWRVMSIVCDDVRRQPWRMLRRIEVQLESAAA